MGVPEQSSTRVDQVFAELRSDILAGRRLPGARLRMAELGARHSASMGVLREALSRLAAQGLVLAEPQHGFQVTPISVTDLGHLTAARCSIEALVLREAIEHGSLAWEGNLLSAHHKLSRTPEKAADDPQRLSEQWAAAHAEFHNALLDGCPNPRLRGVASSLRDSAELYRRWSVPMEREDRDIAGEHAALLHATLQRDADQAVGILIEHIQHTTRVLIASAATFSQDEAST
jgi:DNA-binding GntR family transcriptional regulator